MNRNVPKLQCLRHGGHKVWLLTNRVGRWSSDKQVRTFGISFSALVRAERLEDKLCLSKYRSSNGKVGELPGVRVLSIHWGSVVRNFLYKEATAFDY